MYSNLEKRKLQRAPYLTETERLILKSLPENIREEAIRRYKAYKAGRSDKILEGRSNKHYY